MHRNCQLEALRRPSIFRLCACLLQLGALAGFACSAPAEGLQLRPSTARTGNFSRLQFSIAWDRVYTNCFDPDEVQVNLRVMAPDGVTLSVPAFWHQTYERRRIQNRDWFYPQGLPGWKARFAPMIPGRYEAVAEVKDASGVTTSSPVTFESTNSASKGFLRVSRNDPRFLEFSDGTPFFPIGQNLAFIGPQQYMSVSRAEEAFAKLQANGANYLRVWTCCEDWAMAIEARKSAWGRSWDWHPPIVPDPFEIRNARQCLKLPRNGAPLKMDPSHPLALKPSTRYRLSGEASLPVGAALRFVVSPGQVSDEVQAGAGAGWQAFTREFSTGPQDFWLGAMVFRADGNGTVLLRNLSLREVAAGPELLWEADVNRPVRGYYNPLDCSVLDELVLAAERTGLYLQLCMLTRDLYMDALKQPDGPEYDRAIRDAKKFFRYAVARWGASTSVAVWEYWNEMNPGLPTDRFYQELGAWLEKFDPYQHLRATSTWGPSPKDCRHPALDLADTHFYLRPANKGRLEDEVEAVLDRTRWLREQAPNKPAHLGEFGLADDQWRITDELRNSPELADMHNALWASALSGASGAALFWWWERLDQRNAYPIYRPLSRFLEEVPWTSGRVSAAEFEVVPSGIRLVGLKAGNDAWVWCFNQQAAWSAIYSRQSPPAALAQISFVLRVGQDANYNVAWFDTRTGQGIRTERVTTENLRLLLSPPEFSRDIACRITPASRP